MPDLFTHYVSARIPGTLIRDRRLQALLIIGTFLPDLASKGLYWILRTSEGFAGSTHSIVGILLISYLGSLFLDESIRKPGFGMLALGGAIHLLMDMIKDNLGAGAVHPLLPFSTFSIEFGWIAPENVVLLAPLDAVLLGAVLLYERRRDRVRQ